MNILINTQSVEFPISTERGDEFDITKHKNYKLLEDYDKKNAFDIEKYIGQKGKAKLNQNTVITRM